MDLLKEIRLSTQYTTSERWFRWYEKILPYKAERTIKIIKDYKSKDSSLLDYGCSIGLTLGFLSDEY